MTNFKLPPTAKAQRDILENDQKKMITARYFNSIALTQFWQIHILVSPVFNISMATADIWTPEEEFKMIGNIHLTYKTVRTRLDSRVWLPH